LNWWAGPPPRRGVAWCFDPEAFAPGQAPVEAGPGSGIPGAGLLAAPAGAAAGRFTRFVRNSPWGRLLLVVVAVAVAYHYSLMTLMRTLGLDTPLAYLGLVPVIALGIAALRTQPRRGEPSIEDRQVDFIIGIPLLAAAVAIVLFLPQRMSILFWYYRVDLLSLPLFAAGAIALLIGVRTLWRCRLAIGFLVLAWPLPYTWALDRGLDHFTGLTLGALHAAVAHLPVATPIAGGDGSQFLVGHGVHAFQVSVASACAGADSFVGFLLVGGAFLAFLDGGRLRKLVWLICGLALVYVLNLGRILLIFWAGGAFGETFAMDGLHPFIGLVLFCAGVAAMVSVLRLFGLRVRPAAPRAPRSAAAPRWLATSGLRTAGVVLALAAAVLGVANSGLSRYTLVASELGAPRLTSFEVSPAQLPGWSVSAIGSYPWTSRFFGSGSSWIRYQYSPTTAAGPTTVIADVVTTSDLGSFNSYGLQACYSFHGYGLSPARSYPLGGGVQGTMITFRDPSLPESWNALYWVWAVSTPHGTRYERIVLLAPTQAPYLSAAGVAASSDAAYRTVAPPPGAERAAARSFLVRFAQALVRSRAVAASGHTTSGTATSALGTR
jgi:exosortase/archaeosortase family protein